MRVTRKAQFGERIFDLDMLNRLASVVFEKYKLFDGGRFKITIGFTGNTEYELESPDNLNLSGPIGIKRAESVSMTFSHHESGSYLSLSLVHGSSTGDLLVQGTDESWVNEIFFRLQELIQDTPSHSDPLYNCRRIVNQLVYLAAGRTWYWVVGPIHNLILARWEPVDPSGWILLLREHPIAIALFLLFMYWVFGWGVVSTPLNRYFWRRFWPGIDLDFGPEHRRREKRARASIFTVMSVFVIPAMLAVALDFLKTVGVLALVIGSGLEIRGGTVYTPTAA